MRDFVDDYSITDEIVKQHDEHVNRIVKKTGFEWNHACCFMYSAIDEVICKDCEKKSMCEEALKEVNNVKIINE